MYAVAVLSWVVQQHARYNLPIVVLVFNNSGIYGGDRRQKALQDAAAAGAAAAGFAADPVPTAFVPNIRCAYPDAWGSPRPRRPHLQPASYPQAD